jgi:hypothetical protein
VPILSLILVAALLLAPAAAAGQQALLLYEGTFQEVSFPQGRRVVRSLRLELYVAASRGGASTGSVDPLAGARLILREGEVQKSYRVVSAYVTQGTSIYLAVGPSASATLYLPAPAGKEAGDYPVVGRLLRSEGGAARLVRGIYHGLPPGR